MPWSTPTLRQVREMVRDDITAAVAGVSMVGNSVLRVMADANAALAHLTLRYIDWLSRMLLPDTAETEWLDRHGDIWLDNLDGSIGRKSATYAYGSVLFTGIAGTTIPISTRLTHISGVEYETRDQIQLGTVETEANVVALTPGVIGNVPAGDELTFVNAIVGVDGTAPVVQIVGGTDEENDDDLRARILFRIQQPPMGGCKTDYEQWVLSVPGVTRAWCFPNEMGIGTVSVRFMCDELRADTDGFPTKIEVDAVEAYLDVKRPVAVKDHWVLAPIPFPLTFQIIDLVDDGADVRASIEDSLHEMLFDKATPGQTIYRSWIDEAIARAVGEDHHDLVFDNTAMPSPGHLATLGTITYD